MLNPTTLARPYARAAFAAARDDEALAEWNERLQTASAIVADETIDRLTRDPRVDDEQVLKLFTEVGGERFDERFVNFLRVLLKYDRVRLLPDITAQFEHLRQQAEGRLVVEVTSASELDEAQRGKLVESLAKRFGREIDIDSKVDPALIGGAVIRVGDQVIDGSVRGRLGRMAREMTR